MTSEASNKYKSRTPANIEDYSNLGLNYNYERNQYPPNSYLDDNQPVFENRPNNVDERSVYTPAFDGKQVSGQALEYSNSAYG